MENQYDVIVVGAGPGGYTAAIRGAQLGMSVALVEREEVGGTCLNRGCIPTKTLIHSANLYRELSHCGNLGIHVEGASVDIRRLYARKEEVTTQLRQGVEGLLNTNKITLYRGQGMIAGEGTVQVQGNEGVTLLAGKNILIATGGSPFRPPIPGIDLPGVCTSDDLLRGLDRLPQRLAIIGGGVIGVEFATIFAAFGCQVTIIEAADRILSVLDREISQNASMILKKRGIGIHCGAMVEAITQSEAGLSCVFSAKGKTETIPADLALVSTGRKANIEGLTAEGVVLDFNRGVVTDDCYRTGIPHIYAIGDVVAGGIQLAHAAAAQGCIVMERIAGETPESLAPIPSCVYTDPEIATVGLTEQQAKDQGIAVKTGKFLMTANGRSLIEGQERGFIKLVFDGESEILLGAHLMCARATDIIGELATAVVNRLTAHQLAAVIRPHPTFCEGVTEAAEDAFGRSIHITPRKR